MQAAKNLDDACEAVVIIDGDVVVHSTWLQELVAPLLNPQIGAAYGNRWFLPPTANWGSLVRYLWNVAAVVPMQVFGIPWGGSFAIRKSALYESGLFDRWSQSIVHDAPAKALLKNIGLRVQFVPTPHDADS